MFEVNLKSSPLEKDIENKVCKYAESKGMLQWKFTSPAHRSVPDRMFICPGGFTFFIEFKKPGGKITPGQEREIERIQKQGGLVYVVHSVEFGKEIIDWHCK